MEKKDIVKTNKELMESYDVKSISEGLSSDEVIRRQKEYGKNELKTEKISKWKLFFRQFNNIIIYILLVSAVLTLFMGHTSDAIVIALVVIVNVAIGFYQELGASKSLENIKNMLVVTATVYRDGVRQDIDSKELVPGDIVFLEAGDHVPADLRLLDVDNLRIQESNLTGEADSIEKTDRPLSDGEIKLADQVNMAFASTSVTNGSGEGVVIATGTQTQIGEISKHMQQTKKRPTVLMQEINHLGKGITYVIIAVAVLLFVYSLLMGTYSVSALSLAVVTMVVGSIPEGLPSTTSVVLAIGVSDMAKNKQTIVKTLPSVETLGSVNVIATDKTGTLTKNEMTVKDIVLRDDTYQVSGDGYAPVGEILKDNQPMSLSEKLVLFLESGFEANDTVLVKEDNKWVINGEPTDGAFLTLYYKAFGENIIPSYQELDMLPFDSDYRYMAKLVENKIGEKLLFIKGSPDKLLPMSISEKESSEMKFWETHVKELSTSGKRVVAVGYKKVEKNTHTITSDMLNDDVKLLGLAGIIDPPREEVIESLKQMRQAGVEVKMITGDHPLTAKAIGKELGLSSDIHEITGEELDKLNENELKIAVDSHQVFARTTPKNKLDIVRSLQSNGKITAMVGDGVNDAPALKQADIGVSMGIKGTDVAKDSADMILTADNFGTMSVAIKEGRRIYDNIKKSILFLLPTSFAEGLIIAFTILMQRDMPLQPSQLLWINMVSAVTIQFALIFEPAEKGIMKRKPRKSTGKLLNKSDVFQMAYVSVLIALMSIGAYDWLINQGISSTVASTVMINIIVMSKICYLFNIRTSGSLFSNSFFTNKIAFVIIGIMIVLQMLLIYMPFMQQIFYTKGISLLGWAISAGVGISIMIIVEVVKYVINKSNKSTIS
ncbi:HAD-IC family P-type ATPase [Vagococcus sp. JNUCC 83]